MEDFLSYRAFRIAKYCKTCKHTITRQIANRGTRLRLARQQKKVMCEHCGKWLCCPLFEANTPQFCRFFAPGSRRLKGSWGNVSIPTHKNYTTHFDWGELENFLKWEASIPKVENCEESELADEILQGSPEIEYGKNLLYIEVVHQDVDY